MHKWTCVVTLTGSDDDPEEHHHMPSTGFNVVILHVFCSSYSQSNCPCVYYMWHTYFQLQDFAEPTLAMSISKAYCKTAVSQLLTRSRYCSLALSHRCVVGKTCWISLSCLFITTYIMIKMPFHNSMKFGWYLIIFPATGFCRAYPCNVYIDDLVQDCSIPIAYLLKILQSWTKSLICCW